MQTPASPASKSRGDDPEAGSPRPGCCSHPVSALHVLFAAQDFVTGDRFEIARCAGCGLVVTSPALSAEQIARYYPAGYYGLPGERRFPWVVEKLQERLYWRRARQVERAVGGRHGRVLDVGCGRGLLLKEFRRRGWEVQGTELTEAAGRYAREVAGVPVHIGNLDDLGLPGDPYDAIILWHVLEHVPDPRALLVGARRVLKPRGVLLVAVPNFGGFESRFSRDKWFHLDVPRHATHLSEGSLRRALRESGFRDLRWSGLAMEYDAFSFVQSVLNRCGFRPNLLYNLLRGKQAKVIAGGDASIGEILGMLLLATPLSLLSLPITLIAGLLRQGGTLTVLAVKADQSQCQS
jgi:SAM-dependent methyltransferase